MLLICEMSICPDKLAPICKHVTDKLVHQRSVHGAQIIQNNQSLWHMLESCTHYWLTWTST